MLSKSVFVAALALALPSAAAAAPSATSSRAGTDSVATKGDSQAPKGKKHRTALVSPEARSRKHPLPILPPPTGDGHASVVREKEKDCLKPAVRIVSGSEEERFSLAKCDGTLAPLAVERMSVLIRPASAVRPSASPAALAKIRGPELAPGVRRVDQGLVERLAKVVDHFAKPGTTPRVVIVSGYRPTSIGSYHQHARAIDFRIDGVTNEALVAYCKTLSDTGCGYYPNSLFVHMDVRDPGTGRVSWIDASAPGEPPRYVTSWPPAQRSEERQGGRRADRAEVDVIPPMPTPPPLRASLDAPSAARADAALAAPPDDKRPAAEGTK